MPDAATPRVLLDENFDELVPNSDLVGTAGWAGTSNAPIPIGATHFSSQGVAGRRDTGENAEAWAIHQLAIQPGHNYVLSFDAYATTLDSTMPISDNPALFFHGNVGTGATGVGWHFGAGRWDFNMTYLGGDIVRVDGLDGANASFEVHLDAIHWMMWGVYSSGGGRSETQHEPMSQAAFSSIDGVIVFEDFRNGFVGADFDNVKVIEDAAN